MKEKLVSLSQKSAAWELPGWLAALRFGLRLVLGVLMLPLLPVVLLAAFLSARHIAKSRKGLGPKSAM